MAYNRNGQPYPGQYPRYQAQPSQPQQYQYQQGDPNQARRPSFESGDDSVHGGRGDGSNLHSGNGGYIRMPEGSDFMGGMPQPGRTASSGAPGHPYQLSQNPPPQPPRVHASYNPQQYATPAPYGSPPLGSPTAMTPTIGHQPYNPAAYQSTNSPPASYGFPLYEMAAARRQQSVTQAPPEIPPRPWQQQAQATQATQQHQYPSPQQGYGQQSPPIGYSQSYGAQSPSNGPTGQFGSAYTPPAPPPPPSGLSGYFDNQQQTSAQYGQPTYNQTTRPGADGQHNRLPSFPSYQGSGDYATPPTQPARLQTSPKQSYNTSPQRANTAGRHPQARPLPAQPPAVTEEESPHEAGNRASFGYDDILQEVEAAVMGRPAPSSRRDSTPRPEQTGRSSSVQQDPLFAGRESVSRTNGVSSGLDVNYQAYSDDSDAEAAAGLAAMRMAEEQDAADKAWRSSGQVRQNSLSTYDPPGSRPPHGPLPPIPSRHGTSSDSDQIPVDMSTYGGGLPSNVNYHYGYDSRADASRPTAQHSHSASAASAPYSDRSSDVMITPGMDYMEQAIHPFPPFARTDTGDTGGLLEPGVQRRMSFEDGDEATLYDHYDASSGGGSPSRDNSRASNRPLPQVPRRGAIDHKPYSPDEVTLNDYPQDADSYDRQGSSSMAVHKANSVGSYGQAPHVIAPGRSVTDAEHRRRVPVPSGRNDNLLSPDSAHAPRDKLGEIVLPSLPAGKRRKFVPGKLSSHDYKRCPEPWALSAILAWLQEMTEGEADLKEQLIIDGLVALFTHKVPTMNTADAESLGARLVTQMFDEGALQHDEEWAKFTDVTMTGVVYQLTGTGCYSPKVHSYTTPGRCYSHHCMRTLKKIDLTAHNLPAERKVEDWATFYKLKKENIEGIDRKEIERQNNLHEIVTSEDVYMDQLDVLRVLYCDGLRNSQQPIMSKNRIGDFIKEVFGKVDAVKKANEEYLLPQLKYRQDEQGPWIKGFADIFREWIRKAKAAYIEYAGHFPAASLRMRKEAERNVLFRQFLDQMRENERSKRLGWDTYLKSPITRLQRYSLLLATVHKHTLIDNEEKKNLTIAIEEIKNVTLECDARVAEMQKRADLAELGSKLKLRPGMEKVQLNLNHLGREVIFRGDLQRKSSNKFSWVETHAILFDHFMVLAKPIQQRDGAGGLRHEVYDISRLPIPMDLLVLESTNDEAVMKSAVKGISTATNRVVPTQDNRLGRATSSNTAVSASQLSQQPTNSSMSVASSGSRNMANQTVLADSANDKILYPFRVKHLGKSETYVLYATSSGNRQDWCDSIIEAKTRHASALFAQNAEPFRLRVLADTAFNYDSTYMGPPTVVIKGTPLDRSIEECDKSFYGTGPRAGPQCRATVNCATSFHQPYGQRMMAVGTDFGVFLSEYSNPRGWIKCAAITINHVTQLAVLEEFSLFLVLAEKSLIAYNLESICPPPNGGGPPSAESRKPPQKLSGNKDVGFFSIGRQKDRMLIFYKKKEGINSTFKVLEPVYARNATSARSRFGLKKGNTDFCRDFDEFYIPSDTFAINLFEKSLAVSTAKGIEVLTLEKKLPLSIPDLRDPSVASIAARLKDNNDPLGMFRLNENEFLLVFESVGIYVDKHGDVSRAVVMEFVGRAKQAALYMNTYLILIDKGSGFVEVRNANNGRLRQVVSGRDVRLIDEGSQAGTIKICLQHPERERVQLVVELLMNEGQKE